MRNGGHYADAALGDAVEHCYERCMRLLLETGADVNGCTETLILSVYHGRDGCEKLLLEAEADVNICSGLGTPLHHAAMQGHISCIGLLLGAGADVNFFGT